ncbi:hypothetical protein [Marixanthomonas spongiae]|uniref:hypothetical protein n=1 Tax=Marixanthomonas spongiae TaxID=2174845 RepID=UPI001057CA82|nr:hypothetical protein [Marixanthomonas spongiae]
MKNYTFHFLLITIITAILGFSGFEFPGSTVIRFACLVSSVGLLISCLDAVLITRRNRKMKKQMSTKKVTSENTSNRFDNKTTS